MTDVRMQGFARRHTVAAALEWLDAQLSPLSSESVPLRAAAGRVLATPVISDVDVPGFDRATMDGYAVVADCTDGASSYNRVAFRVVGDAMPGAPFAGTLGRGEAVRIMTGAPMPAGSDAVVPAEWTEVRGSGLGARGSGLGTRGSGIGDRESATGDRLARRSSEAAEVEDRGGLEPAIVEVTASVSPGKHVGRRGEDIVAGTELLPALRLLRPQDIGVMSSIGHDAVDVIRRPRVRLVVTGNELLPAGARPSGWQITDANGPMLEALVGRDGGTVVFPGIVRDDAETILAALNSDADIVIVSGGSSVGIEDLAPTLVATHGELAIHGIAMRPSSPTGLGRMGRRLVLLLPGNPVSTLCAYDFFAGRAIRALGGRGKAWPYRSVRGRLIRKISSPIGRLDYARVRIHNGEVEPLAVAGASLLSSTTRADGFVIVADDSEGFAAGADVDVWLYA